MIAIIKAVQIITAALLILCILVQNRSAGLSETFGSGTSSFFGAKRGAEKIMAIATVIFALVFLASSIAISLVG